MTTACNSLYTRASIAPTLVRPDNLTLPSLTQIQFAVKAAQLNLVQPTTTIVTPDPTKSVYAYSLFPVFQAPRGASQFYVAHWLTKALEAAHRLVDTLPCLNGVEYRVLTHRKGGDVDSVILAFSLTR